MESLDLQIVDMVKQKARTIREMKSNGITKQEIAQFIDQDRRYINTVCEVEKLPSRDYINLYNIALRE